MFLGIDIGTSSVKTVVTDDQQAIVAGSSAPLAISRPQANHSEQDPEDWWEATKAAISAIPKSVRRKIQAIGLSGQMHGATLLNNADEPLRPAILWNDGRSGEECIELEQAEPRAKEITGNLIMAGFTAPKLLWVRKHEPEIFRRTACVLLPKDYIRLKLTGEKVSEMSDASGTSWLDVGRREWSDAMLAATGLTTSHMPRLVEGTAISASLWPSVAMELGLPTVPVAGGAGDNAATAAGLGTVKGGEAFLSLGTSGVLFVATDRFLPNPAKAAHAFCHCFPNRWHQMAVMLNAASALDWVLRISRAPDIETALIHAERRGLHSKTPFFLPYLSGERTPHNDPDSRGVFFGISPDTEAADLIVAVLEGVAFTFADGLEVLQEAGSSIGEITVTGGGSRSSLWGKILAAALQRDLSYRKGGEVGAAFGAARLARIAKTGESAEFVCTQPPLSHILEPDPKLRVLIAERRPIFTRLYDQLAATFKQFAGLQQSVNSANALPTFSRR